MINYEVSGEQALANEMIKMSEMFKKDIRQVVPIASYTVSMAGRDISKPGDKLRQIKRRGKEPQKKKISEKTDTSRTSTHWVVFLRQDKKPFFVPVNPNPYVDYSQDPEPRTDKDRAKIAAGKRRKEKITTPKVYNYQQRRKSTQVIQKGRYKGMIKEFDTPQEILAMRRIGRRGLAAEAWGWIGNQTGGGRKVAIRKKDVTGGGMSKKRKPHVEKHAKKWTHVNKQFNDAEVVFTLNNKLTYVQKAYPGAVPRMVNIGREKLMNEIKRRKIAREKAIQKRLNKAA